MRADRVSVEEDKSENFSNSSNISHSEENFDASKFSISDFNSQNEILATFENYLSSLEIKRADFQSTYGELLIILKCLQILRLKFSHLQHADYHLRIVEAIYLCVKNMNEILEENYKLRC